MPTERIWCAVLATCLLMNARGSHGLAAGEIVIIVLSQEDTYHASLAKQLRTSIQHQALEANQVLPVIHLTHEDLPHPGAWTVIPILSQLNILHGSNSSWLIFCESYTTINLLKILDLLSSFNCTQELFIGHAVHDREATIIHHFAFSNDPQQFKYPHLASGFILSQSLLQRLSSRLDHGDHPGIDFSIDPSHELALYIWNNGRGSGLTHSSHLCLKEGLSCASYSQTFRPCSDTVSKESMYFAVKTCKKYHRDRIPVVKNTWGKHAFYIGFYSEAEDASIPTINLGVPNTEHGHCGKTMAILNHAASFSLSTPSIKWVIIVDDDTILSVARLKQLLSCFEPSEALAIGERYGYNVQYSSQGYNYITGGGGMVFSITSVQKIVATSYCRCPSNSTPDDMFLGICLARLGIPITHSPLFHQARPLDYAPEYLTPQLPVSFHKHWMIDPLKVYNKWFSAVDHEMEAEDAAQKHVEL